MDILGTLGLGEASTDPNDVPVGSYDAVVFASEFVLSKNKDTLAHVITFKVLNGDQEGKKPRQWNNLGTTPRDAEGNFPASVEALASYTPTMGETQKSYYKKTWMDCGIPEEEVGRHKPEILVGKTVTIRAYMSNGFKNIAVNGPLAVDATAEGVTPQQDATATPFPSF